MQSLRSFWEFFVKLGTWKKVAFVAVVTVLGYFGYQYFFGVKNQPQYETTTVTKGTLVVSVSESGSVAVSNKQPVTTGASGTVSEVDVKNGDTVTAGQVIARITLDSVSQQKQTTAWENYLAAQNALAAANANMNTLQATLFKTNQAFLQDRGVANPTDQQKADPVYIQENDAWLAAEASYKNQQNVIAQDTAGIASAWLAYQQASGQIVAPQAGVITDITVVSGMQIAAPTSTTTVSSQTIASIKTDGNPIVSVSLSELDAVKVKAGQKATVTFDALPNQTFTGKVVGVNTAGTINSGVTTYPATIVLDSQNDSILSNMSASADIITDIRPDVLLVPSSAVSTNANGSTVKVLESNKPVIVNVTVGESSDTETEITSGLSEGQTIITGTTAVGATGTSSPFSGGLRFGGGAFGGGAVRTGRGG